MSPTTVRLYGALSKVEEQADGAIVVIGTASSGARDEQGEVITPEAMKAALPDYLKWGAIREMHQPHAAGTALGAEVQDDGRTLIEAHIIDPEAVRKVKARVYKGFSVGGKVLARDPQDRSVITKIRLSEISLVDRPCNPEAAIDLWKAEHLDPETPVDPAPRMTPGMTSGSSSAYAPSNAAVRARAEHLAKAAGRPAARYADYVVKARDALIEEHAASPFAALAEIAAAPRLDKFAPSPKKPAADEDQDSADAPLHPTGGRQAGGSDGGPRNAAQDERPSASNAQSAGAQDAQSQSAQAAAKPSAQDADADQAPAQPNARSNAQASSQTRAQPSPQDDGAEDEDAAASPSAPSAQPNSSQARSTAQGRAGASSADDDTAPSDATDAETIQAIHDQAHALGAVCDPDNAPDAGDQDDSAEDAPAKPAAQGRLARLLTGAGLSKVGARNSQDDAAVIQGVHDNAVILGAVCACADDEADDQPAPAAPAAQSQAQAKPAAPDAQKLRLARDLAKARAETERLHKALAETEPRLDPLSKAWEDRLATLEKAFADLPRPARTAGSALIAVSKTQDATGLPEDAPPLSDDAVKAYMDALPEAERGMLLMKAALKRPIGVRRG